MLLIRRFSGTKKLISRLSVKILGAFTGTVAKPPPSRNKQVLTHAAVGTFLQKCFAFFSLILHLPVEIVTILPARILAHRPADAGFVRECLCLLATVFAMAISACQRQSFTRQLVVPGGLLRSRAHLLLARPASNTEKRHSDHAVAPLPDFLPELANQHRRTKFELNNASQDCF